MSLEHLVLFYVVRHCRFADTPFPISIYCLLVVISNVVIIIIIIIMIIIIMMIMIIETENNKKEIQMKRLKKDQGGKEGRASKSFEAKHGTRCEGG